MSHRILVLEGITERGAEILRAEGWTVDMEKALPPTELVKLVPPYDAILVRSGSQVNAEVIDAAEFAGPARPVGKERWAGVVDSVGSHTLANAISQTRYGGAVAACGLAQGMDLPGSVAPFILRSVVLAGVDSVMRPMPDRIEAWRRLGTDLDLTRLDAMTEVAGLSDLPRLAGEILDGKVRGRVVIDPSI